MTTTQAPPRIGFYCPATFDPTSMVRFNRVDAARYFVGSVLRLSTAAGDEPARLNAQHAKSIIGKHYCDQVVNPLLEAGVVSRTAFNRSRSESFGYSLSQQYDSDEVRFRSAIEPGIRRRLGEFYLRRRAEAEADWEPIHHQLRRMQLDLQVDQGEANEIIRTLQPRTDDKGQPKTINRIGQRALVRRIIDRDNVFAIGKTGRVTGTIACVRREIRSSLRCKGERLTQVDIVNSQPSLLAARIQHSQGTIPDSHPYYSAPPFNPKEGATGLSKSTKRFIDLATSGWLNEDIISGCHLDNEDRPNVKRQFMADVLAKKGEYRRDANLGRRSVEHYISERYPDVYRFVRSYNRVNHGDLIRQLQRDEVSLVIHGVASSLVKTHPSVPLHTVHDAIYAQKSKGSLIVDTFYKECERRRIRLTIDCDGERIACGER